MKIRESLPDKLFWLDLEMTGLDVQNDVILEVAAEITDFNFKTLDSFEATIKQPKSIVVKRMQQNKWWSDFPANRDEFIAKSSQGQEIKVVEQDLVNLLNKYFQDEPAILAGNSIHNDRQFIKKFWPELDLKLHYRMLDVSAWKVLMQGKYSVIYEKKEVHRAFDDIQASIAELQYYLQWFKVNK
ncbi:MAG TPA: oligoribonuclease [Patescibacteria group bacterium]|nr:oligoribonuclease [Patescibacteria group bacterium]